MREADQEDSDVVDLSTIIIKDAKEALERFLGRYVDCDTKRLTYHVLYCFAFACV